MCLISVAFLVSFFTFLGKLALLCCTLISLRTGQHRDRGSIPGRNRFVSFSKVPAPALIFQQSPVQ